MPHELSSTRGRAFAGLDPTALVRLGMAPAAPHEVTAVPGYEMLEPLGRGAMGDVFLARQLSLGREVAVKVLRADITAHGWLPERFEQEARTMATLRHPNIVTVHDCVRLDDGRVAIVMELVKGGSLRRQLAAAPHGLPLSQALRWAREIADGLRAAHGAGIVHRDVKPDNVLIGEDGAARVSDFGMAFSPLPERAHFTQTGSAAGTPGYMAPELWCGSAADARADIFSFGAMLYEMLTGRLPQGSFPPARKLRPEVPEAVDRIIPAALRPDPADRPADMSAMLRALSGKATFFTRRRVIAAGAAAVAAAGAGWWSQQRKTPLHPPAPGAKWKTIPWPEDPAANAISGGWSLANGMLLSDDRICILPLLHDFPESSDVRLRFTRLAGELSIGVFVRMSRGTCVCTLDGRGRHYGGVQSVNYEVLNADNGFREALENGRSYDWTIELRPNHIRMWLNGAFRDHRDITGATLSIPETWAWKPKPGSPALLIGSWNSPTRFEWMERFTEAGA